MDLNYDGLMLESHMDPDNTWSDKSQQVTPQALLELLGKLVLRQPVSNDTKFLDILGALRSQIDMFDDQLIDLMEQRMHVSETIGKYKKDNNITILQNSSWEEIIRKVAAKGQDKGLSAEFIDQMFKSIHLESINHQIKVMNV